MTLHYSTVLSLLMKRSKRIVEISLYTTMLSSPSLCHGETRSNSEEDIISELLFRGNEGRIL